MIIGDKRVTLDGDPPHYWRAKLIEGRGYEYQEEWLKKPIWSTVEKKDN